MITITLSSGATVEVPEQVDDRTQVWMRMEGRQPVKMLWLSIIGHTYGEAEELYEAAKRENKN